MVMRAMRNSTKWIMLVTALAFVGLMVFEWGMDLSGRSSAASTGGEIGRVNGDPVTYNEYLNIYQSLYDQQSQARDEPITTAENRQIEDAAWEQVVVEHLLQAEMRRRGIEATAEEIRQAARFAPPPQFYQNEFFQTDGQFDIAKYHQFLASSSDPTLLAQLEAYYRDLIPRSKLYQQVTSGVYATDADLWQMWRDRQQTARVRYARIDPERAVPDSAVSVTESEIRDYYRANRDEFRRPAEASVRYVVLDRAPLPEDSAATLARVRQIRSELTAGADFAAIAQRESSDLASAQQGGSLGTVQRGQMVPAFDQAVWSLPIDRVSEPVLTQFGYHLILVESREDDEAEVRHILVPVQRTEENEIRMLDRADSLEALGETGSIEEAASNMGLRVRTGTLRDETQNFLPGVGLALEGSDWALEEAVPGDVSPLFETPEVYYMLEMVESTPARTLPVEEATPEIRARLIEQKKVEQARAQAAGIAQAVRSGTPLAEAAAAQDVTVAEAGPFTRLDFVPGLGRLNPAIGTAFGLKVGQTSEPVVSDGDIYVIELLEKSEPDRAEWEAQKEQQRVQVAAALQQQRWEQFVAGLREDADVDDNREILRQQPDDPAFPLAAF